MAQASSMGPPLSPRETRRSGRRSAHSGSTGTSKSPDSDPMPRPKDAPQRPALASHNSGSKSKRMKQEDLDDVVAERKNGNSGSTTSSSSTQGAASGRSRRKKKDKDEDLPTEDAMEEDGEEEAAQDPDGEDEEEQGITRCVCGSAGASFSYSHNGSCLLDLFEKKTTQMRANSWFSARLAKSGSTDCVWDTNPRISFTMTTITASNVAQTFTENS